MITEGGEGNDGMKKRTMDGYKKQGGLQDDSIINIILRNQPWVVVPLVATVTVRTSLTPSPDTVVVFLTPN